MDQKIFVSPPFGDKIQIKTMSNKINQEEQERRMVFARETAAQAWTTEKTSSKTMDLDLAEAFAEILVKIMYAPHLGCATTENLIDEVKSRIGEAELQFKPIDSD